MSNKKSLESEDIAPYELAYRNSLNKQSFINRVFNRVAEQYDFINDLMSLGMHRVWKNAMVARLTSSGSQTWKVLDLAGGTGDIAFRIVEAFGKRVHVTVADINPAMLEVGQKRAEQNGTVSQINFIEANAEALPFDDSDFDACTIAFGIRNVPDIMKGLQEIHRVLKTGSRFLCLEFSHVDVPLLDSLYDMWSSHVIPEIGQSVIGDKEPYLYLVESIRKFPNQEDFSEILSCSGFESIQYENYAGGIVALHSSWKL